MRNEVQIDKKNSKKNNNKKNKMRCIGHRPRATMADDVWGADDSSGGLSFAPLWML